MVKYLFFMLVAAVPLCAVRAQNVSVGAGGRIGAGCFEGEVAAGATFGHASLRGFDNDAVGFCLAAEGRYNFGRIPFDAGLRLGGAYYSRQDPGVCTNDPFPVFSLMAVADYNLHLAPKLTLFAGIGVGGAYLSRTAEEAISDTPSGGRAAFCAMPRIGCECWNRLRVTLGYMCTELANRHLSLTLGIVIGGGGGQ